MLENDSNFIDGNIGTSSSLLPRSRNVVGNRTYIGWKHGYMF